MALNFTFSNKKLPFKNQFIRIVCFIFLILFLTIENTYSASITISTNILYNPTTHAGHDITIGPGGTFTINNDANINTIIVKNGGSLIINAPNTLTVGMISNLATLEVVDFQNGSTATLHSGAFLVVYGLLNNSNNSTGIILNGSVSVIGNITGGNGSQIIGTGTISATGTIITSGDGSIFGTQNDCNPGPCNIVQRCGYLPTTPTANVTLQPTCSTPTGTIVVTAPIGAGYEYQLNYGSFQLGTTFTGVTPGNHTIKARLGSSPICISLPLSITVNNAPTLPATPTITAGGPLSFCSGGSVTLTSSAGTSYLWSNGATTQSINVSTAGSYSVHVTNAVGCQSAVSAAITVTVNAFNTWLGGSSVWNFSANWSCGIPTASSDILIPSGLSNYPILNDDIELKNVVIQSGAILNVDNNGLTITGNLTLNGKIDLQNESQLVQTTGSNLFGDGTIEIDQQGTDISYYYNYWNSPVYSINSPSKKYKINDVLRDGTDPSNLKEINFNYALNHTDGAPSSPIKISTRWIYKFINLGNNYSNWIYVGNTGELNIGEGFTMKGSNSDSGFQNYTFIGKPNNGDINLSIGNGNMYLTGNPYPSVLDADEFIDTNTGSINGTLYFWDHLGELNHNLSDYDKFGYATYSKTPVGGVPAGGFPPPGPPPLISRKVPQRYIPVAQGFFVSSSATGGQIQFNNSQRKFVKEDSSNSVFIRTASKNNSKNQSSEADATPRIYLNYNSPMGYYRQLLVAFLSYTTDGIDYGFDAINIDQFKEDLYWKTANTNLVIQAVPTLENRILPIEVKVATKGIVKISIDRIENIAEDTDIQLKDKETGMLYNLRTAAFEINLNPGTYTNRFEIVLKSKTVLDSEMMEEAYLNDNLVSIYLNNFEAKIHLNKLQSLELKEISIYNLIGQKIYTTSEGLEVQHITIPFQVRTGVYIIKVTTNKGFIIKKILKD